MSAHRRIAPQGQVRGWGKKLQHILMRGHVALYRFTNGKVGGRKSFLILTTIGRKSGREQDTPLFFFMDADHFIILASNGGASRDPIWWLNLQSNPQAKVQIGPHIIPVIAKQADAENSKHLWSIIATRYENFLEYQKRTSREIPIVILTPRAENETNFTCVTI